MKKIYLCFSVIAFCFIFNTVLAETADKTTHYELTLPDKSIVLYSPIEVEKADGIWDGGSIGVAIKDSKGTVLSFCLDQRINTVKLSQNIQIGAFAPDDSKQKLDVGGKEEKTILMMLQDWEKGHTTEKSDTKNIISGLIAILKKR